MGQAQRAVGVQQKRGRGGVSVSGEDVDDDRGGVDALIEGFAAGGFLRHQAVVGAQVRI